MRKIALAIIVFLLLLSCKKKNTTQQPPVNPPFTPPVYYWEFESAPVWADEFDVNGTPDANKWGYDVGGNGWGNNELQYYTNSGNAAIENGILKITAKKENYSGRDYTSARMVTRNKADWLYGRIEVKAKIPKGRGTWPAIWTLPTESAYGSWPKSGEIDLMEHVGFDLNRVHFTIHTEAFNHTLGTQKGNNKIIASATDSFHVYRADWTPYGLRGYFDGEKVFEFSNQYSGSPYWPFDKKFHLILNIAVGGNWGGAQGIDNAVFPAVLEVDYVRVYKFVK
ncbi:MAG: glycoside hydrolase family 16 protein [Chitinophagaceae bacterium]|nr:glycoside hydrolase family 16 protein [Chitinophagaceae bacterium]